MSFLNKHIKSLAYRLGRSLPAEQRQDLVRRVLADDGKLDFDHFCKVAEAYRVTGLIITGGQGTYEVSIKDRIMSRYYAETGEWATSTINAVKSFFEQKGSGTYIDVGANVGMTVIPISMIDGIKCIALEPEPNNFNYLLSNVANNKRGDRIELKNIAAFDRNASIEFELSSTNMGDHRIRLNNEFGNEEKARQTINVAAAPLDDIVTFKPGDAIALKIDTQGAEPFVVAGAKRTLSLAGLLIMEFTPYMMKRMGGDPNIILESLEQNFTTAQISIDDEPGDSVPISEAVSRLRNYLVEKANDPAFWLDVYARK